MTCINQSRDLFGKGANRPISYPLRHTNVEGVVSARIGRHNGIPRPLRPGEDGFCEAMDEVVEVRAQVIRGEWPKEFLEKHFGPFERYITGEFDGSHIPAPIMAAGVTIDNPDAAAQLVRMDWPGDLGKFIWEYLVAEGVPFRNHTMLDFVEIAPGFEAHLSMHITSVLNGIFEAKWYYGCVRPEEYFGIDGCVFTAYPEGCPKHPAYPAGHGGTAGGTWGFVEHFFDFTDHPEPRSEVVKAIYHFAMYRTFSGVHTAEDNVEGIKYGYTHCIKQIQE